MSLTDYLLYVEVVLPGLGGINTELKGSWTRETSATALAAFLLWYYVEGHMLHKQCQGNPLLRFLYM